MNAKETMKVIEFDGNVTSKTIEDTLNKLTNPSGRGKPYRFVTMFFSGRTVCAVLARPGA